MILQNENEPMMGENEQSENQQIDAPTDDNQEDEITDEYSSQIVSIQRIIKEQAKRRNLIIKTLKK